MMGMRRAYDEGYENVNQYRKDLEADAANKGLDPDQVAGMKMPVLVRVREESDIDRREFVELANVSPVSSMRESERAKTDAERLTRNPETLRNLDVNADGDIFTPANKQGIYLYDQGAGWQKKVINSQIKPAFSTGWGLVGDNLYVAGQHRQVTQINVVSGDRQLLPDYLYGAFAVSEGQIYYESKKMGQMDIVVGELLLKAK